MTPDLMKLGLMTLGEATLKLVMTLSQKSLRAAGPRPAKTKDDDGHDYQTQ
jgi:hypothetical protein